MTAAHRRPGGDTTALAVASRADAQVALEASGAIVERAPLAPGVDGPLAGARCVVKASVEVEGMRCTAGSLGLGDVRSAHDAPVVALLRGAGAAIVATTTLDELSLGVTGAHGAGQVRHPLDAARSPGGSSAGTAVAVAIDGGIGVGTDTGGSVRIPAALCGVVGFRPSRGRYPGGHMAPIAPSRDTVGLMARTVAEVAAADAAVVGASSAPPRSPRRVLAVDATGWCSPDVVVAYERAIRAIADGGVAVERIAFDDRLHAERRWGGAIVAAELHDALRAWLEHVEAGTDLAGLAARATTDRARAGLALARSAPTPGVLAAATAARRAAEDVGHVERAIAAAFEAELVLAPTTPTCAPRIDALGELEAGGLRGDAFAVLTSWTAMGSILGRPGATVPVASRGLPVGLAIDGLGDDDDVVLAAAAAIEPLVA